MRIDRRAVSTVLRADNAPSRFAHHCLEACLAPANGIALDVPCGAGRHIEALSARGYAVVGADLSGDLLREAARSSAQDAEARANTSFVLLDAARALPFAQRVFDLVLVVHFFLPGLVRELSTLIKPDGHFILETFGAQGGNHAHLPLQGQVRSELHGDWAVLEERERSVRSAVDRRVVQFFGRRERMLNEAAGAEALDRCERRVR